MAKPEWGIKRICPNCGARYYDLRKEPPVCPNCGTEFDPEALLRSRRARPVPVEDSKKAPVVAVGDDELVIDDAIEPLETADDMDVEDIDPAADTSDEVDDVLLEDASELGEDDDMGEVVDVGADDDDER